MLGLYDDAAGYLEVWGFHSLSGALSLLCFVSAVTPGADRGGDDSNASACLPERGAESLLFKGAGARC